MALSNIFKGFALLILLYLTVSITSYGKEINITAEEQRKFNKAMEKLKSFNPSEQERQKNPQVNQLAKIAENLRRAEYYAKQRKKHLAEAKNYRETAAFIKQHSGEIDKDFNQLLVQYVIAKEGREKAERLFAGQDSDSFTKLKVYAKELSNDPAIMERYLNWSKGIKPN